MTRRPQRLVFGAVAEEYDANRPGYPDSLFDDLLARVGPAPHVVDVGCGTGRVAVALAARGVRGVGVEPDAGMAGVARRALEGTGWQVLGGDFETAPLPPASFDLLTCGQAWHWVDPVAGLAKAVQVVRPGGVVALFWNRPRWTEGDPVRDALDEVYARLEPDMASSIGGKGKPPKGRPPEPGSGPDGFSAAEEVLHDQVVDYSAEAWRALLSTHSDHLLLPEDRRRRLHDEVTAVIDAHGGTMAVTYRCECWVGTRSG